MQTLSNLFPVGKRVENGEILSTLSRLGLRSATQEETRAMINQFWPDVSRPLECLVCGIHEDGYCVFSAEVPDSNNPHDDNLQYELLELDTDNTQIFGPTNLVVVAI